MNIYFNGRAILDTDYYVSNDHRDGVPWAWIADGIWNVLLPSPPIHPPSKVQARPVRDNREPDGWRWRIELPEWRLPLYARCIKPQRPPLPQEQTCIERKAVFYYHTKERKPDSVRNELQIWAICPLWIVRGKISKPQRRY